MLSDKRRKVMFLYVVQRTVHEADLLNLVITCDETRIFTNDPETFSVKEVSDIAAKKSTP